MQAFLEPLKELADYQEIVSSRRKKTGFLQIAGCVNSQKIHLAKALSDGFEYRVIVFSSEEKAKQAYEEWRVLEENVWFYPARDLLFYHADIKGAFLTGKRMEVLRAIVEKKGREVRKNRLCMGEGRTGSNYCSYNNGRISGWASIERRTVREQD